MGYTVLERGRHPEGAKKIVYKFTDGVITAKFRGAGAAALDAGLPVASLSSYITKRMKKPRKMPANVEYSYSSKLSVTEEEE